MKHPLVLHRPHSLKAKLIIYFLMVALVPTITLSLFFSRNAAESIKNNYTETRSRSISQVMDSIERQQEWVMDITRQIILDTGITDILARPSELADNFDLAYRYTVESVATQYQYSPVSEYVRAIIIEGFNGAELRFGSDSSMLDLDTIRQSAWYQEGRDCDYSYWGPLVQNDNRYSIIPEVIPLYIQITDLQTGKPLGAMLLFFDPDLFRDCYQGLNPGEGSHALLSKSEGEFLLLSNESELSEGEQDALAGILNEVRPGDNYVEYLDSAEMTPPRVAAWSCSEFTGWTVVEFLPLTEVQQQEQLFSISAVILIFVAAGLSIILSVFLSGNLTRPVEKMLRKVKAIGRGQFKNPGQAADSSRMPINELSVLNESIDRMQYDIDRLMCENVNKEREKRIFEMQMLQSQINPHFLYNTLNTIKLMATFQGASGIENMLVSLGRILRFSLGETREKVVLRDELGVLEDYIHIQKIRYKGKILFQKEIPEEQVLSCLVPRFILQPVVENAISHGLRGIGGQGIITFRAQAQGDMLLLEISDNGVGIPPEKLEELREKLENPPQKTGSTTGGLGMANVHNRIRLLYGDGCGLTIDSGGAGQGTQVTIKLNLEYGGEAHESRDH